MGLLDSFLSPDDASSIQGSGLGTGLSAIGMALMSSNGRAPFASLPQSYAALASSEKASTSRSALKALLMQAGYSDAEAEKLSSSEGVAKLAIQQKQQSKLLGDGGEAEPALFGGGGASATPAMSPVAPAGPAAGVSLNGGAKPVSGDAEVVQTKFVDSLKSNGLTNPYGLAAAAAYGQHESGYSPANVNRTWSDPSQSGQAGTSGGLLSWRADRLASMQKATAGAADPIDAQARFLLNENPALTQKLQNAKSPEEANALMAEAWKFAGYDKPGSGGEYDARLATTRSYANRFTSQPQAPVQVADASGGVPVAPVTSRPLGAPRVQTASNEQETQALEGRMGMYPPNVYGVTPNTQGTPRYGPDTATGRALAARQAGSAGATQVASADAADMPAPDAQEAGFIIPPGAAAAVEKKVGAPPTPVNENIGPTTQRAQALANFNYWGKRLRASAALGEAGKGLMEEAKIKMGLAQKYLEPSEAERLADAAGLQGQTRQQVLSGAIAGNASTSLQKEYGTYVQQERAAGREPLSQIDYDIKLKGAGRPEQNTTIKNFANPIAKGLGDQFLTARQEATDAAKAIPAIHQSRALLDEGIFTGPLAEQKLKLAQVASVFGIKNPKIESTEAFGPVVGQQVLANIKVLGVNPSNADRDFAEKMAGGKITLNEGTLRRIMDINENAHRAKINNYNQSVDPLVNTADDELKPYANVLKVREPAPYQKAERAQQSATPRVAAGGPAEGATATNRTTGAKVIFRGGQWVPLPSDGRPEL